jgi:alpha-tubulin suppressor-like RCC1 family protein
MIDRRSSGHPSMVSASILRPLLAAALALVVGCGASSNAPASIPPCADGGRASDGTSSPEDGDDGVDASTAPEVADDAPARDLDDAAVDASADAPGGETTDGLPATCAPAPSDMRVTQVAVGGGRSCAILAGGALKCWGSIATALGLGDGAPHGSTSNSMGANLPAVDLGTGKKAVAVSLGAMHTCVLLDDATVKCFGGNSYGQLGLGNTVERGGGPGQMGDKLPAVDLGTNRKAIAVSAGYGYSCALLEGGSIKCWGSNGGGALGQGDARDRGANLGEMGDALMAVDLGAGKKAVAVSAGSGSDPFYQHTCALLDDGSVKCWGSNVQGELGLGDRTPRGGKPGQMGDALPSVDLGTGKKAVAVSAGYGFTCALLDDKTVKCWGSADDIGLGRVDGRGAQPGQMGDHLPAVDLGTGKAALAVGTGYASACALLDGGSVKCWGMNYAGQLGLGDKVARGTQPRQMGDALPAVDLGACRTAALALGNAYSGGSVHVCALLESGALKCWGSGGELGTGDTVTRGDDPGEMGDALPTVKLFSDAW